MSIIFLILNKSSYINGVYMYLRFHLTDANCAQTQYIGMSIKILFGGDAKKGTWKIGTLYTFGLAVAMTTSVGLSFSCQYVCCRAWRVGVQMIMSVLRYACIETIFSEHILAITINKCHYKLFLPFIVLVFLL